MSRRFRLLRYSVAMSCLCGAASAGAATSCSIANLMPEFWKSIDTGDAAQQLRRNVIAPHADLYNENFVDLPSGQKWEQTVAREQVYIDAHRDTVSAAEVYLLVHAQPLMRQFQRTFPDYKCNFTFYIAPSFGQMDGSAAYINQRHLIIFAPDVIPRYHRLEEIKILVDHETFHIYHHQATGVFGASDQAVPTVLEAVWGEGLATFVSWRMNPQFDLDTALLQPGIPQGSAPHLQAIAHDLASHLDLRDEPTYLRYFVAGKQPDGYPPRAGYYVGALIAEDLSARYTLREMAHLNGAQLRALVAATLEKLETAH
jgi:hypothetical protein